MLPLDSRRYFILEEQGRMLRETVLLIEAYDKQDWGAVSDWAWKIKGRAEKIRREAAVLHASSGK